MSLNYTAFDFETANSSRASACSIGLVKVRDGRQVDTFYSLIRPPFPHDEFNEWNIRIHGITPGDVADAPGWPKLLPDLLAFIDDDVLVAHNAGFDAAVLRGSAAVCGLALPEFRHLCSLRIARSTYNLDSYRLPVAAMAAGFEDFSHHNALDDAAACAAIIAHAAKRHGASDLDELATICGTQVAVVPASEPELAESFA